MKTIVYLVGDHGIDGREPESILYASFDEAERNAMLAKDKSKAWRHTREIVVDPDVARAQALSKLDGIDRLVLGLSTWPSKELK